MRKSLLVAGTATIALGTAGIAYAQLPAPTPKGTVSVSPAKAGTKAKPVAEKFVVKVVNNDDSKTTASKIVITFPSTLKWSTKGLPQCTKSDAALATNGTGICSASKLGSGTANAKLNPFGSASPIGFKVTPLVGKNEILFFLAANAPLENKYVVHGKINSTGRTLTISIPKTVQEPIPGAYSALSDLGATLYMKKGTNSLVTSTGCKGGKHKVSITVSYAPNPSPPVQSSATTTANAKCS